MKDVLPMPHGWVLVRDTGPEGKHTKSDEWDLKDENGEDPRPATPVFEGPREKVRREAETYVEGLMDGMARGRKKCMKDIQKQLQDLFKSNDE